MPLPGVCLNILEARHKQDGYGCFANPEKFLRQDFQELKQYCVIRGVRFIDKMFPPDGNSIGEGLLSPSDMARVVWLRPAVSVLEKGPTSHVITSHHLLVLTIILI